MKILKYTKALVPAVATVIAVGVVYSQSGELTDVETLSTAIGGAITTFLTFLLPNKQG